MTGTRRFDPRFLREATPGTAVGNPLGDRVVSDSREDVRGALFVALEGPRFDGHDFVEPALKAGAGGAVISAAWWGTHGRERVRDVFVVPNTLLALQELAGFHRRHHPVPLVAITGSNGKTTTKELLAEALRPLGAVLRSSGNRNNHIGLPLTLLELTDDHDAAVVEIGLNQPGELRLLGGLARPRVAVITNVTRAHLEGLGSLEGVARAKAEIAEALPAEGVLVVPEDLPVLEKALRGFRGRRVTFGRSPAADFHPRTIELRGLAGCEIVLPDGTRVETGLVGDHVVDNLLAAVAAAETLGVSASRAAPHMGSVSPLPGRLHPRRVGGVTLLDDSYNANPTSLAASLALLRGARARRRWAILGDMLELGEDAIRLHREVGTRAAFLDGLVTVGELGREIGRGAIGAGLDPEKVEEVGDGEEAARILLPRLQPGDLVLVKGSRGVRLESAVARLTTGLQED